MSYYRSSLKRRILFERIKSPRRSSVSLEIFKILVNRATLYFAKRVNYLTKSQPIRPAFLFDEYSNYFNTRSYLHEFNLACNIISQLERWRYRSGTSSHIDLLLANR